jgi:hypothetical protein
MEWGNDRIQLHTTLFFFFLCARIAIDITVVCDTACRLQGREVWTFSRVHNWSDLLNATDSQKEEW